MSGIEEVTNPLCILATGLSNAEINQVENFCANNNGKLVFADSSPDLWSRAEAEACDLCLIGQSSIHQSLSDILWLLKGMTKPERLILIASNLSLRERKQLRRYKIHHILIRPFPTALIIETMEKVLHGESSWKERIASYIADSLFHPFSGEAAKRG
ncbi:MAG: hypothetical protein AB1656_02950 [Candidatus Omnitrophota bacterium]